MSEILRVEELTTQFRTDYGLVRAVDGVSFTVNENEIVGLVGESGCGKSVTMLSVMQLITNPRVRLRVERSYLMGKTCSDYRRMDLRSVPSVVGRLP